MEHILAIIQARTGSTRFPNKVLAFLEGKTVLEHVIARTQRSKYLSHILVATTILPQDLPIVALCANQGISVYCGSEWDVLDRYYQAARLWNADQILRITADCPLLDAQIIDQVIQCHLEHGNDYTSNTLEETYPDGLDCEIMTFSALKTAWQHAFLASEREHVTPYIWKNPAFQKENVSSPQFHGDERWTLDTPQDFRFIQQIYHHLYPFHPDFGYSEVLTVLKDFPQLRFCNQNFQRNEGFRHSLEHDGEVSLPEEGDSSMGHSQTLYQRAKQLIPGGTQLLSKRPEMFLPNQWPAYYSRAKGCEVWDLDGLHYYDTCFMGIGANVLGYSFEEVDQAAKDAVDRGGMCTLNAPEEVELAEKLIALHPWAQMVRYTKTGGEAMAVAVRIARAFTKKDLVLVCGYHGWHDWYLAANLTQGDPLAQVHLKGLKPLGVPRELAGTNVIFHYNNLEEFQHLLEIYQGSIAAVVMEPIRNEYPKPGYLEAIRQLTKEQGIVLIFDEITAGFRLCCGGSHITFSIQPDLAVFGKAMSNGYPLAAVLGTAQVLSAAQDTFISSTFWTERISLAATLQSISCFQAYQVEKHLEEKGREVQNGWKQLASEAQLPIRVHGIYPLSHFEFCSPNPLALKTYFTQEMLQEGFLASTSFYLSLAHTKPILDKYWKACETTFHKIAKRLKKGESIEALLPGGICQEGFQRLN